MDGCFSGLLIGGIIKLAPEIRETGNCSISCTGGGTGTVTIGGKSFGWEDVIEAAAGGVDLKDLIEAGMAGLDVVDEKLVKWKDDAGMVKAVWGLAVLNVVLLVGSGLCAWHGWKKSLEEGEGDEEKAHRRSHSSHGSRLGHHEKEHEHRQSRSRSGHRREGEEMVVVVDQGMRSSERHGERREGHH